MLMCCDWQSREPSAALLSEVLIKRNVHQEQKKKENSEKMRLWPNEHVMSGRAIGLVFRTTTVDHKQGK